jgi:hypothetical protein
MTIPHRAFISTLHSRLFRFNDSQTLQFILKSQRYGVLEAVENLTVLPSTKSLIRELSLAANPTTKPPKIGSRCLVLG